MQTSAPRKSLGFDKQTFNAVNHADDPAYKQLNAIEAVAPPIMHELREATVKLLIARARKPGESVVKIRAVSLAVVSKVRGYVTFGSCLQGASLAEAEDRLGFKAGVLQAHGAHVYRVDPFALTLTNIAPRGTSAWSGGITPRDLHNLSQEAGKEVSYHPNYPSARASILQFFLIEEVRCLGQPVFVGPGGRL